MIGQNLCTKAGKDLTLVLTPAQLSMAPRSDKPIDNSSGMIDAAMSCWDGRCVMQAILEQGSGQQQQRLEKLQGKETVY